MYGWCETCEAIALEGLCSKHGETKAITAVNAIDVRPLPEFEKQLLNERLGGLKLGSGIFLIYGDRLARRIVVTLNEPLAEIRVRKDCVLINPLTEGKVEGMDKDSILNANRQRLDRLVRVSKHFSEEELKHSKNAVISFSGGKDSTVLMHLLEKYGLETVFIDTTIEFPETYKFINELKKDGHNIDTAKARSSFFKLCSYKGYPTRRNRWCCKTQKFEPFERYLIEHFRGEKVTVFDGTRRWESLYRMDEPLKRKHKCILNQYSFHSILDWTAMDAWMYIWLHELPVNEVYNYFDRGGCWLCPFGLSYRIFVLEQSHPKHYKILQRLRNNQ